jgi:hypothetical protein
MAEAGDKGIPLEDYIKLHEPEPLVRVKLDRGQLRYAWVDADGNQRSSDDSGPQPPKGWWLMGLTVIDCERRSVRGCAFLEPTFPPMFFVRVFPAITPANTPSKAKGRPAIKFDLVLEILADIDQREGLASNLQPAEIEKKVLPCFRPRWTKLRPDDDTDPPVSRTVIYRAYQEFLRRSAVGRDAHDGPALARSARSSK